MDNERFDKMKKFAVRQAALRYDDMVNPDTSLETDLGIYGDDAVEFIIAFGKEFKVDVTRFMAADYFKAEEDIILPAIIRFFTEKKKRKQKELKLKHLENVAIAGRLDEDGINN
jgi:hypothetical protein